MKYLPLCLFWTCPHGSLPRLSWRGYCIYCWLMLSIFYWRMSVMLEKEACLRWSRCGGGGAVVSHGVNRDLGELQGVRSLSTRLPLDPFPTLWTPLWPHVEVSPIQVGVSTGIEPPSTCRITHITQITYCANVKYCIVINLLVVCICCTCIGVGTVGVLVFIIIPVLGGELHACVVTHGLRQISR